MQTDNVLMFPTKEKEVEHTAIFVIAVVDDQITTRLVRQSSNAEVANDFWLMDKVVEFKYAARRQNLKLVVDMVPPWKARILKLLGIRIGE